MAVNQFAWSTKIPTTLTTRIYNIDYSSSLAQYCAVGDSGKIITSSDGDTWALQTSGVSVSLRDIVFANSIWVAVGGDGDSGTNGTILTSSDGSTWASRTFSINTAYIQAIVWTGTNFVVCGDQGIAATSSDGITWTQRTVSDANDESLYRMAYGSSKAVMGSNTSGRMWYSDDDGASWARAADTLNSESGNLGNLIWTGSCFIATGVYVYKAGFDGDRANTVSSSADGYTWISDPFPYCDIRAPKWLAVASDGAGEAIFVGHYGYAWAATGTSGNLTWTELDENSNYWYWFRGAGHDGSSYFFVGDANYYEPTPGSYRPIMVEGSWSSVTIATAPSPTDKHYGTSGTNITPTDAQLSWTGIGVGTHKVYFGKNRKDLDYQGNIGAALTYDPGTLEDNTSYWWRIDIVDGIDTYVGDIWHFITEPAVQPDDEITVLGDTSNLTSSETEYGWDVVCDFDHTDLVHGHRYFVSMAGKWKADGANVVTDLFLGDKTETTQTSPAPYPNPHHNIELYRPRGIFRGPNSGAHVGQFASFVLHPIGGEDIVHQARGASGTSTIRYQQYFMALDLDSPGMVENVDWFHIYKEQNFYPDGGTGVWQTPPDASITFTPDGYSDYLVVACANWYGYNCLAALDYNSRLYDSIDGELRVSGYRTNYNTIDYQRGHVMNWVLEKPEAVERTVSIDAWEDDWTGVTPWRVYGTDLFILRLTKFEQYNYVQSGAPIQSLPDYTPPTGTYNVDTLLDMIKFTPDDGGKLVSMFGATVDPAGQAYGCAFQLRAGSESDGTMLFQTEIYPPGGPTLGLSDIISGKIADAASVATHFGVRTIDGVTETTPIYFNAGARLSSDRVMERSIVVFGTKYAEAPRLYDFRPVNGAKGVAKTNHISFAVGGIDGIDRETLNVDVLESSGWVANYGSDYRLRKVASNGSLWVAVGNAGTIITSPDGYDWTAQTSGTAESLYGIAYGNSAWAAVGNNGIFLSSSDGVTWADSSPGGAGRMYDVVYAGGQFVAVGDSGYVYTSTDATSWTLRYDGVTNLYGVGYDSVGSLYCACGANGYITTSPDGISWTTRTSNTTERLWGIAHDQQGRWIIPVLYNPLLLTSTDGLSWSTIDTYLTRDADLRDVNYGGGKWVVTGTNGTIITSDDDSATWHKTKIMTDETMTYPAWNGTGWVAVSFNGNAYTSPNGGLESPASTKRAVVDGVIQSGFDNVGADIVEITDGYDGYRVTLVPSYSTFDKNSFMIVTVNAGNHRGIPIEEYKSTFYNVDGYLSVLQYVNLDATPAGWHNRIEIPSGTFADGHRYLFFLTGSCVLVNPARYAYLDLQFNGISDYEHRSLLHQDPVNYYCHTSGMFVRDMVADDSLVVRAYSWSVTDYMRDVRLVAIDLDSDPSMFVENDNWIYISDSERISNMDNTWTNNVGATLTFTPDGYSDYLIFGSAFCDSHGIVNTKLQMRIYDSILGELIETLHYGYSNYSHEVTKTLTYVFSAPAAVERTLYIEMIGANDWDHDESNIFVLKMDSFIAKDWAQTTSAQNGFTAGLDTVVENLSFNTDSQRYTLIMGTDEYSFDARQEFDIEGANVLAQPNTEASALYFRAKTSGDHQSTFAIVGKTAAQNPSIDSIFATSNSGYYLYRRNLIALGTEFYADPPDKAVNPDPANGETDVNLDDLLSWDPATNAVEYDIYFGTDADPSGNFVTSQESTTFDPPGQYLELDETYYWRVDSVGDGGTVTGDVWTFDTVLTVPAPTKAIVPDPADDATGTSVDKIIGWTPGTSILEVSHDIYFGTDADPSGNFQGNQLPNSYDPGPLNPKTDKLDASTDYYWRIDERNAGGVTTGDVWHFTTESVAAPNKATFPLPGNSSTGVIPDENLTWSAGTGALSHDVYFGTDADPSGNYIGNQTSATYNPPGDMIINQTYYWRVDEVGPGGVTLGDVWSFTIITELPLPTKASSPNPLNGQTTVRPDSSLTWSPGTGIPYIGAITHDIYFGENPDPSANFKGNSGVASYNPVVLEYSTTYYWRIDEVSAVSGTITGDVWSFSTAPMLVIEPRNGDICYSSVYIRGSSSPRVGVNAEVHASSLIGDGYTTTDANGDFVLTVPYQNQDNGTHIRLCMVTRASPDSEEVTINLIQGREPPQSVVLRTSKSYNVDANTVALWRFGKSSLAEPIPSVPSQYHRLDFVTADKFTPPTRWQAWGTTGFAPTFEDGVMTVHCYSTPGIYSRLEPNLIGGTGPDFAEGFRIKLNWKMTRGNEFSPEEGDHIIFSAGPFYVHYDDPNLQIGNAAGRVKADSAIHWDKFDWANIEVVGHEVISGDINSRYVELYVNNHLIESAIVTSDTPGRVRIGQAFTSSGTFTATEYGYTIIQEYSPFLAHPGTNLQGDTNRDLPMRAGVGPHKVEDNADVPFDYCLDFNNYLTSNDDAFDIPGAFTIEGWVNADYFGGTDMVICGKQAIDTSGWALRVGASGTLQAAFYDTSSENVADSLVTILTGTWYHVALTYDGLFAYLYINGELKASLVPDYTANTAQPFRFGAYSESGWSWNGKMANFRLSNVARSAGEIHGIYNALLDPQEGLPVDSGALAVYNFDEPKEKFGRLISSSHRNETAGEILFSSQEEYDKFFRPTLLVADAVEIGPADGYVELVDNGLNIRWSGTFFSGVNSLISYTYGDGRHKLSGDFDLAVNFSPRVPMLTPDGYGAETLSWATAPYDDKYANAVRLYITSASGATAQMTIYKYRDQEDPGGSTLMHIYFYGPYGGTIGNVIMNPADVKLRIVRKDNMWFGYYGTSFVTNALIPLGKTLGPDDDCVIRLQSTAADDFRGYAEVGHRWSGLNVRGFNDPERVKVGYIPDAYYGADGYLFSEVHGTDAYGTTNTLNYRHSAVGSRAREFDGAATYLQFPSHADWNHQDLSIDLWFQANSVQSAKLISRLSNEYAAGWHVTLNSDGTITAEIVDSGGNTVSVTGGNYSVSTWNYVAITFDLSDSGRLRLYFNGSLVVSSTMASSTGDFSSNIPIDVGRDSISLSEYYAGAIGAIRISNVVRSAKEMFDYYNGSNIKEDR